MEHCACDNAGTFCLVVSDKGTVYFGGVNKKGEAGEAGDLWRQIERSMVPLVVNKSYRIIIKLMQSVCRTD